MRVPARLLVAEYLIVMFMAALIGLGSYALIEQLPAWVLAFLAAVFILSGACLYSFRVIRRGLMGKRYDDD
jgi:hypothetical protein